MWRARQRAGTATSTPLNGWPTYPIKSLDRSDPNVDPAAR
jgi:hypothetical protein